jgi:hypothetical protein
VVAEVVAEAVAEAVTEVVEEGKPPTGSHVRHDA